MREPNSNPALGVQEVHGRSTHRESGRHENCVIFADPPTCSWPGPTRDDHVPDTPPFAPCSFENVTGVSSYRQT